MKYFFGILLSLILILGGAGIYFYSSNHSSNGFETDSVLIKTSLRSNGFFEGKVKVINTGIAKDFSVELIDLVDLAEIGISKFSLAEGESQEISIKFSNKENLSESVYVGGLKISAGSTQKIIPLILEIESNDVLFDSNLALFPTTKISSGDKISSEIKIFDLSQIGIAHVELSYFVKNFQGETIISEGDTIVVENQVTISKSVDLPETLEEGDYVFGVTLRYKNSVGTSSSFFRVGKNEITSGLGEQGFFYFILLFVLFVFILLISIFYSVYSRDRLLDELKNEYKCELQRQRKYLQEREISNEKKLKTSAEKKLNRKIFANLKKQSKKKIILLHKERKRIIKNLKRNHKKGEVESQIAKWKKKGYDTSVLEKNKLPTVKDIQSQIINWKKRGYNTSVLEK